VEFLGVAALADALLEFQLSRVVIGAGSLHDRLVSA
jgi:hypothetical protein